MATSQRLQFKALAGGAALCALMSGAGAAWAQTAPVGRSAAKPPVPSSPDPSQDIIVTATRSTTNLQNTPVAVTALTAEALQQKGITNLLDVQNATPSLTVSSRTAAGTGRGGFTIRGIGVDSLNSSSAVGIYVDEVYYPAAAGNLLGLFDIDRLEVLRGPQGTLFGRNTIAGAVQYITTKPSHDLGGYVTGTVGNLGRLEAAGALNLPVTDTLAIRVAGRYNRSGGYVYDELNGFKRGREVLKQGRAALRWQPNSAVTVDLKGEFVDSGLNGRALAILDLNRSLAPPGGPSGGAALVFAALGFGFNPAALQTIRPSDRRYSFQGFNARDGVNFTFRTGQGTIAWDIANWLTLKSISAYSYSKEVAYQDLDNTPVAIVGGQRGFVTDKLITQEIQAAGKAWNERLHYTLGGYYYSSDNSAASQYFYFASSPVAVPPNAGDPFTQIRALAGYGQLTLDLTGQLSVTGGLRYSDERVTGSFLNYQVPGIGTPTVLPTIFPPFRSKFNDWSPSAGVNLQLRPTILVYAKASKGFRAGGVAANGNLINPAAPLPAVTTTPGYQPFSPETAWTYELGARLQFLDRRIRINPTVFYTDWKNIQFNSFLFTGNPPTPNVITRNAGDARIWGVELEWQAVVSPQFRLNGSFSYLNGKYRRIAPGIDVSLSSELQHAPDLKYSIGARYAVPLQGGDELAFNLDWAWTADQRSAVTNSDFIKQPAYGLLNGRIQYNLPGGKVNVAAYATNLLNEYYYIGGVNGATTFASTTADLGRPREFGLNATLRF